MDSCWSCRSEADVKPMAFIEEPTKLRFHLCAKCRDKEVFRDGALTELRSE